MHMYISWVSIVQTPHPLLHGYGFALYPLLFCGGSGGTLLDTGRTTSATGTNSTMTTAYHVVVPVRIMSMSTTTPDHIMGLPGTCNAHS